MLMKKTSNCIRKLMILVVLFLNFLFPIHSGLKVLAPPTTCAFQKKQFSVYSVDSVHAHVCM